MPRSRPVVFTLGALAVLAQFGCGPRSVPPHPAAPAPKLTFNESIEPILSENCYACHGPDPGGRKAGLRLDRGEFAFAPHEKSGPAIIPGQPDKSPLIERIQSQDLKQMMPPAEAHKSLSSGQIALLRRWIQEGAVYQEHWSFIPPVRPEVPTPQNLAWVRTPIDAFILHRLEKEKLAPAPEADRPTLIRRVTYDLTGLPPTPAEVDAFLRDPSPTAYENVVDRLLASPRYGEHRAHYWLDAARYGDTHGLHSDNYRSIWPYRDYVIASYNQNKPFDQFTREQLAGDLLPPRTIDQLVGSAFVRAGICSGEGGSVQEELRVNNQRERTEAFGAVYLGLTTGCAVCHDHKFDPISQKDFYRLTAFFNNLTETASSRGQKQWAPLVKVPRPAARPAYNTALAERADLQRQLDERRLRARELVAAWVARGRDRPQAVPTDGLVVRLRCDEQKGATLANSAPHPALPFVTVAGGAPLWGENTWFWPTFRMDTNTRIELPGIGDVEKNQPFSVGTWILPRFLEGEAQNVAYGTIVAKDQGGRGWELFDNAGKLSLRLIHGWPDNLILVETTKAVLKPGRWSHVLATYDGSGRAAGVRLYVNGRPAETTPAKDSLRGGIRSVAPMSLGSEFPDGHPLRQSIYQDFRFYRRALPEAQARRLAYEDRAAELVGRPLGQWSDDEFKAVSDFYFASRDQEAQALAARLPAIEDKLARLSADGDDCLVCQEDQTLAYADVLARGAYAARIERVRPAVPHFLPPLPAGAPLNRRSLAEWVVSPGNPLTARVTVNRMWQEIFGAGLVETTEDFGLMGERPSHPELLDWLAVDFREHGWEVKRFYRQLVLSATYRQSARATAGLLERDPHNRLLARGPRFRMDAEMIRDTALATSGLLVEKVGGKSVKPYQPEGIWENGAIVGSTTFYYVMDHGESLYRRSLYSFWKRMVILPNMDAFDAPDRGSSCTRRQRTDTPLQALVAMNDPLWLEAARHLAERVVLNGGSTADRLEYLGRLLLARPWKTGEAAVLAGELQKFSATYAAQPAAAAQLLKVGETQPNPAIAPAELAPWMLVASTALNLDATLNK